MPFRFNQLLADAGIAPSDVRLLRHMTKLPDGRTPLDIFRSGREVFDRYQHEQLHAQRSWFLSPYWATFVGLNDGRTMFTGFYDVGEPQRIDADMPNEWNRQVDPAGMWDRYPLAFSDTLSAYVARLFIDWGGGSSGKRSWRQRADLKDKPVVELYLEGASSAPFPGLMRVVAPLSRIAEAPPTWADALSAARGIYLLTCPANGETYVGKATGAGGFWQRWMQYHADGHGGNVALRARQRTDYIASILQVAGSTDNDDDISAMETLWKRKLDTRQTGLNRN